MFYHKSSWMLEMEFEFEGKPRTPAFAVASMQIMKLEKCKHAFEFGK